MADNMIDADAQAVAEATIENGGAVGAGGADEIIGHLVKIERHHIGYDVRRQMVEHLRCQPAGAAHALESRRAVQPDGTLTGIVEDLPIGRALCSATNSALGDGCGLGGVHAFIDRPCDAARQCFAVRQRKPAGASAASQAGLALCEGAALG